MTYWYIRMKEGKGGEDFTERMWRQKLIGVLWGTWTIDCVLDTGTGKLDPDKLTAQAIKQTCPQPPELGFNESFLQVPRKFLLEETPGKHVMFGDRVIVSFDQALHIGTVGEICTSTPEFVGEKFGERFKCRHVLNPKPFSLAKLPASYRLVSGTGQGTLQRAIAYKSLVALLDQANTEEDVKQELAKKPLREFLSMLSDKQWEVVCEEFLRSTSGYRSLLLGVGGSLKDIDLCGVDRDGTRLVAQCKNSSRKWKLRDVAEWATNVASEPDDSLYFFNRGGFDASEKDEQLYTKRLRG